ncbi:MAG: iron-containing alcohol dehydrogenase [Clostridia bacterium]|nr:iron-containing alcohol dehydrogenase [Clostridia bacterium]
MRLEDAILKIADSGEVGRYVKKGVGVLAGGLMDIAFPFLIPTQDVVEGPGSSADVVKSLKRAGGKKALIITDKTLHELGILDTMLKGMDAENFPYAIYDGVEPNPSIENVEAAFDMYKKEACDCLVGFGGGSSMDACKAVSCRVAKPEQTIKQMGRLMGYFPISFSGANSKVPYIVAVPTTAGTGAESTVAAVISDHVEDRKYTVTDISMRPRTVFLDASLATGLPPRVTAVTAIDAVSHCTEGFISYGRNPRGDEWAIKGVRLVKDNIEAVMADGKDLTARQNLCTAAYCGGQSLNMETTGYIHPFCHKIGAKYNLVHGRCIGAVMPIILEDYGEVVAPRLAKLAVATGIADPNASESEQAKQYIQWIRDFDAKYGIDPYIPEIRDEDLDEIADSIMVEIFVYPNKKVYTRDEIKHLLKVIRGDYANA